MRLQNCAAWTLAAVLSTGAATRGEDDAQQEKMKALRAAEAAARAMQEVTAERAKLAEMRLKEANAALDQARRQQESARKRADEAITRAREEIDLRIQEMHARTALQGALEHKAVKETYLGVVTAPVPEALAAQLGEFLHGGRGVLVNRVLEKSPAVVAGIKPYDVLTSFNGESLSSSEQLKKLVTKLKPEEKVKLSLLRAAKMLDLTVGLGERDSDDSMRALKLGRRDLLQNQLRLQVLGGKPIGLDASFPEPIARLFRSSAEEARAGAVSPAKKGDSYSVHFAEKDGKAKIDFEVKDGKGKILEKGTAGGTRDEVFKALETAPEGVRGRARDIFEQLKKQASPSGSGRIEIDQHVAPGEVEAKSSVKAQGGAPQKSAVPTVKKTRVRIHLAQPNANPLETFSIIEFDADESMKKVEQQLRDKLKGVPDGVQAEVEKSLKRIPMPLFFFAREQSQ